MFAKAQLNELAECRRWLVLEADLQRSLMTLEGARLRARLAGLHSLRARVAGGSPWLVAGAAAAGLVASWHWRKVLRWVPAALTALRWVRVLKGG